MSFLDHHCIIFDNEEENKLEYTPVHNEFKNLVEDLIGCLLAELDVTQEVFMEACEKANKNPVHKKIVDQIVAVDNFVAFKKLMCKRNTELNEQAMKMLLGNKIKTDMVDAQKKVETAKPPEPTPTPEQKEANSKKLLEEQ